MMQIGSVCTRRLVRRAVHKVRKQVQRHSHNRVFTAKAVFQIWLKQLCKLRVSLHSCL